MSLGLTREEYDDDIKEAYSDGRKSLEIELRDLVKELRDNGHCHGFHGAEYAADKVEGLLDE